MNHNTKGDNGIYSYSSFDAESSPGYNYFLWWCSGAHTDILKKYPSEHSKYTGLGALVLTTFVLAALAGGYAFFTVFQNIGAAVLFGALWGLIIFNLDRFLVSTMRKYGVPPSKQFKMAVPRIILAILIGFTIARPFELKIFEKEVDVKVQDNMHEKILKNDSLLAVQYENDIRMAASERAALSARKLAIEDTLHRLQLSYIQEADGTGGSGRRGIESLTRLKMAAYEARLDSFKPELENIEAGLKFQDSLIKNYRAQMEAESERYKASLAASIGFLEKNKALTDLQDEESSVWYACLLISLLIIIIETGPVFAKLMMPKGPYDIALGTEELLQMAGEEERMKTEKKTGFERREKMRMMEDEILNGYYSKLSELQQKAFAEELEKWHRGETHGMTARENLEDFLDRFKKKCHYSEFKS